MQHEYGIYGGTDGDGVGGHHRRATIPSIVDRPHGPQRADPASKRSVLGDDRGDGRSRGGDVGGSQATPVSWLRRRSQKSHHHRARCDRPEVYPGDAFGQTDSVDLGSAGAGKGIERVIEAMGSLRQLHGPPRYLIAGRTHPKVLAADGEAYRDARAEQARRTGVADSVCFDASYRDVSSLTALIRSSAVVVLPYDSTDQVTSGVLVDALASGRPVVATAFPHAVELLGSGAGIVVDHDDPDALASALRRVLTDPRLAGSMAAEARRLAPTMAWPVVANAYLVLAQRILAKRQALV